MKIRHFIILAASWIIFGSGTYAQIKETSIAQVLNQARSKLDYLSTQNVNIARVEFDVVTKDEVKSTYRYLYAHRKYKIIAFGDGRKIKDIDMSLFYYDKEKEEWIKTLEDNSQSSEASIEFTPSFNGTYNIDVKAFGFLSDYTDGHYGLIIYYYKY